MEIVQHEVAPKALVNLITTAYQDLLIERVILLGGDPTGHLQGRMGLFVAETGSIIIDMKACMADRRWMEKGMTYISNVWCNLIYTAFHEGIHARQFLDDEIEFDESTWDVQHAILDHAADLEAHELMINWFSENDGVPPLNALGWVGKQLQALFNNIYHKADALIDQEIELWGAGMPLARAAQSPELQGDAAARLEQAFQRDPSIGVRKNGTICLRIDEALELVVGTNRS